VDYYSQFPAGSWGMLGNDSVGDCVCAAAFHGQDVFEFYGQNVTPAFTTAEAISMYEAISGYNPNDPNSDVGATLQDGLGYWQKTGLAGYKIDAYAEIDYRNTALLQQCIADFGVAYLALEVPASAMQQFDAGQPWSVVRRSPIEGGHCVPAVGYDAQYLYVITWGAVQKVEWAFYAKYFEEAWVPISTDWMEATGKTPSGLDAATANADFQQLTGSSESPFPVSPVPPTPPTPPTPVPPAPPGPTPPAVDAATFLAQIATDLGQAAALMTEGAQDATDLQAQITAWLAANGGSSGDVPPHHHGH
jgi:hypothetical protein